MNKESAEERRSGMIQSIIEKVSNKVGSIVDSRKMLQKGNRFDKK